MESEKTKTAGESEVLETLTRILRREETEDCAVKLREETRTTNEDGKTYVERGEHLEIVKVRPKLSEVIRAAELIGKSYGMFSERVEGSIALPLIICGEDDLK
ncbi:MAG: terminase small subunit [Clostridia bacterium]|nr:terminase small subunit [Clostridia bacterium]